MCFDSSEVTGAVYSGDRGVVPIVMYIMAEINIIGIWSRMAMWAGKHINSFESSLAHLVPVDAAI